MSGTGNKSGAESKSIILLLLPLIAGCMWGSSSVFVRMFTAYGISSFGMVFLRMSLASVLLFVILWVYDRSLLKIHIKDLWLFIVNAVLGVLGLNYFYNIAIDELTASFAAVLLGMSPVFVLIFSFFLFKEKITGRKFAGVALAIIGCMLVSGVLESSAGWTVFGVFTGIASAFFYGIYSIFSRILMNRGYHSLTITFYGMLIVAIATAFTVTEQASISYMTTELGAHWGILIVHSLLISTLPYMLFNLSLSYVDTGKASILAAAGEPSMAMVVGAIAFMEVPSVLSACGLVVTICAITVICAPEKKKTT